jgi:transcriptional regulator with XRE-family HTH domain
MLLTLRCAVRSCPPEWEVRQLAAAAGIAASAVERFEEGRMVELPKVQMILEALQGAGLEFIPAGGKSLDGGPGLRTTTMPEPEVAAAEEALELEEPVLGDPVAN